MLFALSLIITIFNFTHIDVPDPPERPLIISFTSRSVNLSWAHSQDQRNAFVEHFIIETRVGENGPWDQVSRIYTKSNVTSYQVTGLLPFTVYSFRTIAVNKLGVSTPSKESYYIVTLREGTFLYVFFIFIQPKAKA